MTVKQLLRNIDSDELVEWQAWMIVRREDQKRVETASNAENKLRAIFGKPNR